MAKRKKNTSRKKAASKKTESSGKGDENFLEWSRTNWHLIVLALILLFGFYLRTYHLDYPVIGYHNWKETHYLTEARSYAERGFFQHGFFVPEADYMILPADQSGAHADTLPTISIVIGLFMKIFGSNLIVARIINILFSLGSVLVFFYLIDRLFKNKELALISSFILAVLPLHIFFGRQTQLINPALFFTLLGILWFFIWKDKHTIKNIVLAGLFIVIGIMTKYTMALIAFPLIFFFPYKSLMNKKLWKQYIWGVATFALLPLWIIYSYFVGLATNVNANEQAITRIEIDLIFQSGFWNNLKGFTADNFTYIGLFYAVLGLIILVLIYLQKRNAGIKYFFWYAVGLVPWFLVMAKKLSGHNYHFYPILPIIAFLIGYFFYFIAVQIARFVRVKQARVYAKYFIVLILVVTLFVSPFFARGGIIEAKNRMFDTQFIGLDVAGEFIKENSEPTERILFPEHQSFGVLWHADRKGTWQYNTMEQLLDAEAKGHNWIFLYEWGIQRINEPSKKEVWEYIQANYELKQFAFVPHNGGFRPLYFLLKRGGTFDPNGINDIANKYPTQTKLYEYTTGTRQMLYVDVI